MALLVTLLALMIIATVSVVLTQVVTAEIATAGSYRGSSQAFYAADGGAEHGLNELLNLGRSLGRFPTAAEMATITGPPMANSTYADFQVAAAGPQTTGPLTSGYFQGLVAATQPFIRHTCPSTPSQPTARANPPISSKQRLR